jgi:hypothetical protein
MVTLKETKMSAIEQIRAQPQHTDWATIPVEQLEE